MSRGLGKLQRAVLAAVDELGGRVSVLDLACHVTGIDVAVRDSDYESTRRAVTTLCKRDLLRPFDHGRRYHVRYSDGTEQAHKNYGRPEDVEAMRLKK